MGHYCRICGRHRPNEKFSGKGHKIHICKECQRKPKGEIKQIEILEELGNYLRQSNISGKNIKRLQTLTKDENREISEKATIILDIARVYPYKRRRLKFLAKNRKDLMQKLEETGLIFECQSY